MPSPSLSAAIGRIADSVARRTDPDPTDGRLLARFVQTKDGPAFAELVRRLGPMVLGVCRRVSGDHHLAEDAFQAAFVVLARRAADVSPREAVRGWLYGVAVRVAREARKVAAKRRTRETPVTDLANGRREPAGVAGDPVEDAEAVAVLDEEVGRLPEHLRTAVVLCELGGVSRTAAAARLGIPEGTLSSRLGKARKLLAARLKTRGVALGAGGLAVLTDAAVSSRLLAQTSAVATATAPLPAAVAALSHGVTRTMYLHKLTLTAAGGLLLAAVAVAGVGSLPRLSAQDPPKPAQKVDAAKPAAKPVGPNQLAFCRNNRLVLIDPAAKDETAFLANGVTARTSLDGLRLSPDGKHVAFLAHDPAAGDPPPATGVPYRLYVAGADARETEPLGVSPRSFAWSRDGTAVAVTEFPAADEKLAAVHTLIDVKTKEKTALKLPDDHYITDWSQDGKHLVTTRIWPEAGVFLMNLDGTGRKHLTDKRLPAGRFAVGGRLSPDGTRVLLKVVTPRTKAGEETKSELAVLTAATGTVTPVADTPLNGEVWSYCWSPDGKRIAYAWSEVPAGEPEERRNEGIESSVVTCDPDGKHAKTIVSEKGPLVTIVGMDWR